MAPIIQVSLDVTSIDEALDLAGAAVRAGVVSRSLPIHRIADFVVGLGG